MNANDILRHIYATCNWVNPETTVDRVIAGDAEKPVRSALVTWISSRQACREVVARGADLLVTHEPTFWNHRDDRSKEDDADSLAKQREIDESGLVILRLHDSWDLSLAPASPSPGRSSWALPARRRRSHRIVTSTATISIR